MKMRATALAAGLVLTMSACTGGESTDTSDGDGIGTSSGADVVLLETADGAVLVHTGSGDVLATDADAFASPDGSRLYVATNAKGTTEIETRDAATGAILTSASVPGDLDVRAASVSGDAIAMMEALPEGADPWAVVPRARTTIVIVDPTGATAPRPYHLEGNFEPEAFSVDDSMVFLIQHLPAEQPTAYRVTSLDLASGEIRPIAGRFKVPPQRMPGVRLRQVFDPQTDQLYTLYTNEPSGYARGYWEESEAEAHEEVTFVHVLNLRKGWAFCAGVPKQLWGRPARAQAMATSPDGRLLYIVDSVQGRIVAMDTRSLEIVRSEAVDLGSLAGERTSAVTSADGTTLFVSSASDDEAVYAIDTDSFAVIDRWAMAGPVGDLGLSADGARLYAALTDSLSVLDPASGAGLGTLFVGGIDAIVHVETSAPAA